jgi:hypothetical protein
MTDLPRRGRILEAAKATMGLCLLDGLPLSAEPDVDLK